MTLDLINHFEISIRGVEPLILYREIFNALQEHVQDKITVHSGKDMKQDREYHL